jgi:phosphoglucosamine mutase
MAKLFGTDGIRGRAGQFPLDAETVRLLGSSLTTHLRTQLENRAPVIVIGRDTRESGPWLEEAFIAGATDAGAECKSAGVITTPGVAFLARVLPADTGVVISASHNPYPDNGVKIFSPSGRKLSDAIERLLEADIHAGAAPSGNRDDLDAASMNDDGEAARLRARYLDYLAEEIASGLSLTGTTMLIDCANGAASQLAPELFARLGANVIAINDQPDGKNINQDCGSLNINGLQLRVSEERVDLGVAFDGDADRALFVDGTGRFVDGDATMWVLATDMDQRGELHDGIVVGTVMSNIGLEIALRNRGLTLVRSDVGDKYVLDELVRSGATLGGEQSGHLIFPKLSLAGDGMITTLCLLRALKDQGQSLAEATSGFERYPQILVNIPVTERKPFVEMADLQTLAGEIETKLSGKGRLLLRYSGTELLARVMIEGENQSEIESYAHNLAAVIRSAIGSA